MQGCQAQTNEQPEIADGIHKQPNLVPFNLQEGYRINQITSDTIKPISNSFGKTAITGKPILFEHRTIPMQDLFKEFTKSKSKTGEITEELDKIYLSIGDISAKMREVIWSLNTENDSLENLIYYLQKQSRIIMEHYQGQLSISIPDKIPEIRLNGHTRRNIYLSVKEALHNIIKHSDADKIDISIL